MVRLDGTLVVQQRKGRHGVFSVGELITEIGNFKVKDTILDQYEEGRYQGSFLVSKIYVSSYMWNGGVNTEIRANLEDVLLESSEETSIERHNPEAPDPIEEQASPAPAPKEEAVITTAPIKGSSAGTPDSNPDITLFGDELYAMLQKSKPIKLDPTVDRSAFRGQRDRLKELGYVFDAKYQTWMKN